MSSGPFHVGAIGLLLLLLPGLGSATTSSWRLRHSHRDGCASPFGPAFDMHLQHSEKTITVPPVPTDVELYGYAADNAMVAIPTKCHQQFQSRLPAHTALEDRQPEGRENMAYFRMRISDPENEFALLAEMRDCACGLAVELHGSGGAWFQTTAYAAMMASLGFIVVVPDSMAMPDSMGLKGKRPLRNTSEVDMKHYCGAYNPYYGSCDDFSKPFCYSTKPETVLHDQLKYRTFVERAYLIRKLEMDYLVEKHQALFSAFGRVFLIGSSEGGMVAARYYHQQLHPRLSGIITSQWSCNYNYFLSCAAHSRICENTCGKELPLLNFIGDKDEYFGAFADSVSSKVAADEKGYGGPITGHCRAAFDAQGFSRATVVTLPDADHDLLNSHDNTFRSVLADFLAEPGSPSQWNSLKATCSSMGIGHYSCPELEGHSMCREDGSVAENATWKFTGQVMQCAMPASLVDVSPHKYIGEGLAYRGI